MLGLIAKINPYWNLIIAGLCSIKIYLKKGNKVISKYNLNVRVRFLGMIKGSKKLLYLKACDLFVLPSHAENFGISIAEAMASKLPVLMTTKNTPGMIYPNIKVVGL